MNTASFPRSTLRLRRGMFMISIGRAMVLRPREIHNICSIRTWECFGYDFRFTLPLTPCSPSVLHSCANTCQNKRQLIFLTPSVFCCTLGHSDCRICHAESRHPLLIGGAHKLMPHYYRIRSSHSVTHTGNLYLCIFQSPLHKSLTLYLFQAGSQFTTPVFRYWKLDLRYGVQDTTIGADILSVHPQPSSHDTIHEPDEFFFEQRS